MATPLPIVDTRSCIIYKEAGLAAFDDAFMKEPQKVTSIRGYDEVS
jgi:hypothetical protein